MFITPEGRESIRRFYREFVKPYRWRALLAIVLSIPVGTLEAALVAILQPFCDEIMIKSMRDGHTVDVAYYPLLIIVISLAQSLFKHFSNYLNTWVGKKISMGLKFALFDKLLHNDPAMFDKSSSGDILQYYSNDADLAGDSLLNNVTLIVQRVATSAAMIAVMFYNSWILSIVAVGALILGVVPLSKVRRKIKLIIKESVQAGAAVSTNYNEAYIGNRTITAYDLYDQQLQRLKQTMNSIFRLNIKLVQRLGFMSITMHTAVAFGLAAVLYIQGYLFVNNMVTPGNFVSFMVALILLYTPMKSLANNYGKIQSGIMSVERVLNRLDEQPAIVSRPGAKKLDGVHEAIRYNNVSFSYEPGRPVLRGINLEIRAGCSVAFVGNSGGGKTTLANLIPRFYDVDSGSISIDGTDIRDIELTNLRSMMSIVFQDNFLFGGTIRDNIAIGKPGASDEDIARAVRSACLEDFIATLDQGLDTYIGERGTLLSGGQKQRVAIARAFLKDAPIVILDEATSALDNKSETVVQEAIENLMLNKTVIIIAHRLSTVINADNIAVVRDGELVEQGRHAELMAIKDGVYASLYRTQLV